ncbi:MAG: hypothetical protein AAF226_00655 [Verrucomicrobiota bacterium]
MKRYRSKLIYLGLVCSLTSIDLVAENPCVHSDQELPLPADWLGTIATEVTSSFVTIRSFGPDNRLRGTGAGVLLERGQNSAT